MIHAWVPGFSDAWEHCAVPGLRKVVHGAFKRHESWVSSHKANAPGGSMIATTWFRIHMQHKY